MPGGSKKFIALFTDRKMPIVFMLGICSGLPFLLIGSTLQAWFKVSGISLTRIGLYSMVVGLPYGLKFLWAPLLDYFVPPIMGRRRGWILLSQLGLAAAIAGVGVCDPKLESLPVVFLAFLVTLFAATQDIGIDAYQIELFSAETYAIGNQLYIIGYRIGMLMTGGAALILADRISWHFVYYIFAVVMTVGMLITLLAPEPCLTINPPRSIVEAVWLPLKDFFSKDGSHGGKALWILAFFLLYKLGGDMATSLTTPFYIDLGFSMTQIGSVVKGFGLGATMLGGILGATGIIWLGLRKSLWVFGIIQALSYLSFAWLTQYVQHNGPASVIALATAVSIENIAAGLGTAAYGCYMASLVNKRFTATQYALLSSLMGFSRVISPAQSGWLATELGWQSFFIFCAIASVPGLLILLKLTRIDDTGMQIGPEVSLREVPHIS